MTLVLKAKWDPLEVQVRTDAPVLLVLREPADSLASWDSLDPKEQQVSLASPETKDWLEHLVYEVCRAKMERRVLLDPLAQPARLEREESRDNLVLMVSRVCLVLPALLVREANLETWVFLERLELPVPLGPEVSEDFPEREVQPDPRVCKVLEVCLELLEPTAPKEALDLVVPQELRGLQVCKACLEREEELAFLDPRETGVIWERKDLRVRLVKTVLEVSQVP